MKSKFFLLSSLALIFLSGCAIQNRVSWQNQLIVTLINNTNIDFRVLVDGREVKYLPSASTTPLGFYTFMGEREIIISVQGLCPSSGTVYSMNQPDRKQKCLPGRIVGNNYKPTWNYGDGSYRRAEAWLIEGVRGLTGGLL